MNSYTSDPQVPAKPRVKHRSQPPSHEDISIKEGDALRRHKLPVYGEKVVLVARRHTKVRGGNPKTENLF